MICLALTPLHMSSWDFACLNKPPILGQVEKVNVPFPEPQMCKLQVSLQLPEQPLQILHEAVTVNSSKLSILANRAVYTEKGSGNLTKIVYVKFPSESVAG